MPSRAERTPPAPEHAAPAEPETASPAASATFAPAPEPPAARDARAKPRRRATAFARAAAVMAAVIIVDRLTKHAVVTGIPVGDVHSFLPGIQLVHVRNSGVAFGFFAGGG